MATKKKAGNPPPELYTFDRGSLDKISRYLNKRKLVPAAFRGTDKFIDIVSFDLPSLNWTR